MRGVDYFPRPDETGWADLYDNHAQRLQLRTGREPTRAEYDQLFHDLCRDRGYVEWRVAQDNRDGETAQMWVKIPPLEIKALEEQSFGRPMLAPFKLKYDTLEEVRMRFYKTVILIKGHPFYVSDLRTVKSEFHLLVEDQNEKKFSVNLAEIPDFRSPPAGYVQINEHNGYMTRMPARVNTQGLSQQNVAIRRIGTQSGVAYSTKQLVPAIATRKNVLPWTPQYCNLLEARIVPELRLNDCVAVYTKKNSDTIQVEYKNRRFGTLSGNVVTAHDEDDLIQPWVTRDFNAVNLEIKS